MHKQPVYQNAPAYVNGVSEVIFKVGVFSKTYPSFLTLKEGSTSHLGLLPSGKKRETALLGARNRYAIRLAGPQSPRHILRDGTALLLHGAS